MSKPKTYRRPLVDIARLWLEYRDNDNDVSRLVVLLREVADVAVIELGMHPCAGCGKDYIPVDGRQPLFCSNACRYRIAQRNRRQTMKELEAENAALKAQLVGLTPPPMM